MSILSKIPGLKFVIFFILSCSLAHAAGSPLFQSLSPSTADLNPYRWHNRPLVIFAPSNHDAAYVEQMAMLEKNKTALAERDIIVLTDTSPSDKGQLRRQLDPKGFEVVLVGKDGGMKMRETTPLNTEVLFSTIDQMPMRKANLD